MQIPPHTQTLSPGAYPWLLDHNSEPFMTWSYLFQDWNYSSPYINTFGRKKSPCRRRKSPGRENLACSRIQGDNRSSHFQSRLADELSTFDNSNPNPMQYLNSQVPDALVVLLTILPSLPATQISLPWEHEYALTLGSQHRFGALRLRCASSHPLLHS